MKEFMNSHNPILPPGFHVPDAEGHVFSDGRLYLYGSYDKPGYFFCSTEYHVVSTSDMKNWRISDVSFSSEKVPWAGKPGAVPYEKAGKGKVSQFMKQQERDSEPPVFDHANMPIMLFAPDAIEKDGQFYLYFCMLDQSEGVAVSDSPEGPFKEAVQFPIAGIDPAVFIGDDG